MAVTVYLTLNLWFVLPQFIFLSCPPPQFMVCPLWDRDNGPLPSVGVTVVSFSHCHRLSPSIGVTVVGFSRCHWLSLSVLLLPSWTERWYSTVRYRRRSGRAWAGCSVPGCPERRPVPVPVPGAGTGTCSRRRYRYLFPAPVPGPDAQTPPHHERRGETLRRFDGGGGGAMARSGMPSGGRAATVLVGSGKCDR